MTLAWQLLFLVISRDPVRYRPAMLAAVIEKATYVGALAVLLLQGRIVPLQAGPGFFDLIWGLLFVISYLKTGETADFKVPV